MKVWCTEGAWQTINASHSHCTSTRALIKPRWSARGQVRGILHPSSEFQQASPISLRGHPSLLWLTLFDNHCLHSHQQPCISLKGLYSAVLSRLTTSVKTTWTTWEQKKGTNSIDISVIRVSTLYMLMFMYTDGDEDAVFEWLGPSL